MYFALDYGYNDVQEPSQLSERRLFLPLSDTGVFERHTSQLSQVRFAKDGALQIYNDLAYKETFLKEFYKQSYKLTRHHRDLWTSPSLKV